MEPLDCQWILVKLIQRYDISEEQILGNVALNDIGVHRAIVFRKYAAHNFTALPSQVPDLDPAELQEVFAANVNSSPGPDGWHPHEIAMMPPMAFY